jgi:hypothetical protein
VIVVSILLAFGIEAWWDGVQDRELEREYLERLLDDQQTNEQVIAGLNRQQSSQLHHARRIYPLVFRGLWEDLDTTSAVVSSYRASPTPTPTWVDDTFEELKSTGHISLIRSATVRSQLLEYYRYLETADYTYELMSTAYRDEVRKRMDPDLQLAIRRTCGSREDVDCRVQVRTDELKEYVAWLSSNPVLAEGLRRVIVQWTRAEEDYLPGVAQRTEAMVEIIERELAR